ncbi:hypothetical protein BDW66DRAFT_130506 [Aspergillus desertorum]
MDGLSLAAGVIAVIQLTGSLVELCGGYIQQVKHARDDILTLQRANTSLQGTIQDLHNLVQTNDRKALPTSSRLVSNITDCLSDLRALETRLDPGKRKRLMSKVGWRALMWPLKRTEVEDVIQKLERYKSSFLLSLQVDQSSLIVGMVQDLDLAKLEALHEDPDIMTKSLREQFEKLLLQPLLTLDQLGRQTQTVVIVIDALDECDHDHDIRAIIRLLPSLKKVKAVSLRIFVTSRPELPIELGFSEMAEHEYQDLALHEIPEEVTEHDIHLFLQDRFTTIKHDKKIAEDWPGDEVIQKLVAMSTPLFISAATVCRYIEGSKLEPRSRLAEILNDQAKYVSKMDKTYMPILTRLLDNRESDELEQQQLLQEFQDIIGVIILLAVPLSINTLSLFLGIEADKISNLLDSFRSVLNIPRDRKLPVRILHLSFRDFLVRSQTRVILEEQQKHKARFLVNEQQKHKAIAKFCLKTMQRCLRKDICNLASPGTRSADIDDQDIRHLSTTRIEILLSLLDIPP